MPHFEERLRGEQAIREMKEAENTVLLGVAPHICNQHGEPTCGGTQYCHAEPTAACPSIMKMNSIVDPCQDQKPWTWPNDSAVKLVPCTCDVLPCTCAAKIGIWYMVTPQQQKCLSGEHEAEPRLERVSIHIDAQSEAVESIAEHLSARIMGSVPFAMLDLKVMFCRHCRCLYVERA